MSDLKVSTIESTSWNPIIATGGTISNTSIGNVTYRIHQFTSNGSFEVTNPGTFGEIEFLIVAGGGGGGMDMGGGGGGGGVISGKFAVSAQTYAVIIGAGGWGAPAGGGGYRGDGAGPQPNAHQFTIPATNGGNSSAFGFTSYGGGFGGSSYYPYTPGATGNPGASGGGASGYSDGNTRSGGNGYGGQGFRGGRGGGSYYSGGGGGAGGIGTDSTAISNGGPGVYNSILGTGYYWGGGGGGSGYTINGGNGGIGGGGGGAVGVTTGGAGLNNGSAGGGGSTSSQTNKPGGNGGTNTGGGGGGGSHYNLTNQGGNGGSGIVIVRYPVSGNVIFVEKPSFIASPNSIIQVVTSRTDDLSVWSAPTTLLGPLGATPILPLSISITPKRANSLIFVRWLIVGEVHYNTKWTILLNNSLCTVPGFEGYNAQSSPGRWVGYVSGIYETSSDLDSTLNNYKIQFILKANTVSSSTMTLTPAISASGSTAYNFYLNRTIGAVSQSTYENGISTCVAMEISQ